MKFKFKLAPIALAAAALFATPYALADESVDFSVRSDVDNDISVEGDVRVRGRIRVNGEAQGLVDTYQNAEDNKSVSIKSDNRATIRGEAFENARGNIGVNEAAGDANVQANDAALAIADSRFVFASAASNGTQSTEDNLAVRLRSDNRASVRGEAFENARGNIGVNVAAGASNVQANALAAAVASRSNLAKAGSATNQETEDNVSVSVRSDNSAAVRGEAFQNARGNIGLNVAAGNANVQRNSLAIAISSGGGGGGGGGGGSHGGHR